VADVTARHLDDRLRVRYAIRMTARTAHLVEQRTITVVRFYKQDHLGDPVPLRNGRIWLGGNDCKDKLRAGIKQPDLDRRDNVVIAIGGSTAKDGLAGRLTWGGVAVEKRGDGTVEFEGGFYLAQRGPLDWRERFPLAARFVDTVGRGHRVHSIPVGVRDEFIQMYEWGRSVEARIGRTPPPSNPRHDAPCTTSPCRPDCDAGAADDRRTAGRMP
jgi:hypothetical protein